MLKKSPGEKAFDMLNIIIMLIVIIVTLYPFYYVICASFSDSSLLLTHRGLLIKPLKPTIGAYELTFKYPLVKSGYSNTLYVLLFALPINMVMTVLCAYVMSTKKCYIRILYMFLLCSPCFLMVV
ncbi:MAG TPA: hypothetical protein DIW17_05440 [Clostridiales bacterium]|nr:hypothetical protein [Clostridiales bacterium]